MFTAPRPGVLSTLATGDRTAHPPILSRLALAYVSGRRYLGAIGTSSEIRESEISELTSNSQDEGRMEMNLHGRSDWSQVATR